MQERILSLVETLDESRKDVLARLEGLPADLRAVSPGDGRWSPLSIVEHLIKAERSIFANMPVADRCIHATPTFLNHLNRLGITLILKYRVTVPVPAQEMLPAGTSDLETLAAEWGEHMAWLRMFVNTASSTELNHACFRHPIAGPLTLIQALSMAQLHVGYHLPTLEKRIRALQKA